MKRKFLLLLVLMLSLSTAVFFTSCGSDTSTDTSDDYSYEDEEQSGPQSNADIDFANLSYDQYESLLTPVFEQYFEGSEYKLADRYGGDFDIGTSETDGDAYVIKGSVHMVNEYDEHYGCRFTVKYYADEVFVQANLGSTTTPYPEDAYIWAD